MTTNNSLRAVPDVMPTNPGTTRSRIARVTELEARVAELEKLLEVSERRGVTSDEALRHVADIASSAALACNKQDLFAMSQLRALHHLASDALENS